MRSALFNEIQAKCLKRCVQRGFITGYILYGIALMAIVGVAYGRLSAANEQGKLIDTTTKELVSQVEVVRGKLLLCSAIYPEGINGVTTVRQAYPATSTDSNATRAGNQALLNSVTCPGSPSGGALTLGQLSDGTPMPLIPPDFNAWEYEHTDGGGVVLLLTPRVSGGAAGVRARLIKQLGSLTSSVVSDGVVVITLLQ